MEALRASRRAIETVWIAADTHNRRLKQVASRTAVLNIALKRIESTRLNAVTGTHRHQGVAALVSRYPTVGLKRILLDCVPDCRTPFLLLLDGIMDPQNLGALIRTAVGIGVTGVIIPKKRAAPPSPAVSKVSAGALEHVLLHQATNLANCLKQLKQKGIWIAGLDPASERSIFSCDLSGALAIVVGGEEKGIRPLVKKGCDFLISIPQPGRTDSLNAAVAGGIAMYEAWRQSNRSHQAKNAPGRQDAGPRPRGV